MNKWAIGIIALTLILAGVVYAIYESNDYDFEDSTKSYEILNKWELPEELDEVSGMQWIGDEKIACVQDEDGIIFIYDLSTSKIIKQYKFANSGDYEALTSLNNELWVAESNGKLFNIKSLEGVEENSEVIELEFEYRNNIEGLAANTNGELWLSVKERNLDNSSGYKGIYSFNPLTNKLNKEPVLKISYDDPKFDVLKTDNPRKLIRPSDITFSPLNDDLYVLDAEFQKVLIVDRKGQINNLHLLDPAEFAQPEGICFSPSGRLFIANESLGGPANIIEVKIN
ncbi:SdiA-regulated domain-containing protein [Christiangramia forsetii]|uniref:SMP-30/Gluconolactonase/LRE-like region domain-containing protein n=2 Tax=Christiangramia forsetii TaxID=411153 RepID=A0M1L6_CHRFK|nr:SdiA-regulated domain-containing protein [Christiangramia forsetii]GGG42243.1 hypothetical protein GCM10011532_27540 [Christiangramia forsetii]CAL66511.1 conserved hypothetical protein, secreted [Christiangramia forsetii KT0803]